jgi:hypothetical protein
MQLITMALAGHSAVCCEAERCPYGDPQVYVDGGRFTGSPEDCSAVAEWWTSRAIRFGATFKSAPVAATAYDFVGLHFNHEDGATSVAETTRRKFPQTVGHTMTAHELEVLVGRLCWAAEALSIPLAEYHFALKRVRRVFNALNRGTMQDHDTVQLSHSCRADLQKLCLACKGVLHPSPKPKEVVAELFTDASLQGWGAVLYLRGRQPLVTGSRWTTVHCSTEIAELEMAAVDHAVRQFRHELQHVASLRIVVDNTTVMSAVLKGRSRSDAVAVRLAASIPLLRNLGVPVSVAYITSRDNPADLPSRVVPAKSYIRIPARPPAQPTTCHSVPWITRG